MKLLLFLLLVGVDFIEGSKLENNKKRKRHNSDKEKDDHVVDEFPINYIDTLPKDLFEICEKYLIPKESSHWKQTNKKFYHHLKITGYHNIFENNGNIQVFRNMAMEKQNEIEWDDPQNLIPIVKKLPFEICLRLPEHQRANCIFDQVSKWKIGNMDVYHFLMKIMFNVLGKVEDARRKHCRKKLFKTSLKLAMRGKNQAMADVRKIIEILKRENKINGERGCFTTLIWAAMMGHLETVNALLKAKAKINFCTQYYEETALMKAAEEGHLETVKVLLEAKAKIDVQNYWNETALMKATEMGHLETVKVLLEAKAKINVQDKIGKTALMKAACEGHLKIVKLLLNAKAKIDVQDKRGKTALMEAADIHRSSLVRTREFYEGHLKIVRLLLNAQAKIDVQDKRGYTALMRAAWNGDPHSLKILLKAKAKTELKNKKGKTAVQIAKRNGHENIADAINEFKN